MEDYKKIQILEELAIDLYTENFSWDVILETLTEEEMELYKSTNDYNTVLKLEKIAKYRYVDQVPFEIVLQSLNEDDYHKYIYLKFGNNIKTCIENHEYKIYNNEFHCKTCGMKTSYLRIVEVDVI